MISGSNVNLTHDEVRQSLALLEQNLTTEVELVIALRKGVCQYASSNLEQVGEGDHYATAEVLSEGASGSKSKYTHHDRAKAVNSLLEVIKCCSAKEVYDFVTTESFRQIAGLDRYFKITLFRTHLYSPVEQFINDYENYLDIDATKLLRAILHHNRFSDLLTDEMLAKFFWSYHSDLVANYIVNIARRERFYSSIRVKCHVNYEFMQRFLIRDPDVMQAYNAERVAFRASTIMSDDATLPGKNVQLDENLRPLELYQYEDETIFAIENWFYKTFSGLLINDIRDDGFSKMPLDKASPYYFYLLSTASYVLVDPSSTGSLKTRFVKFADDCRSLVLSIFESNFNKPIILCGFINVDGNHYVPYFVSLKKSGQVCVLTVDPSPRIYCDAALSGANSCEDSKMKTMRKMQRAFHFIFPGCEYRDANVTQMLRERDCGPNSATTLYDAMRSATSASPLLQIGKDGNLTINTKRLSIHAADMGVDAYTGKFVYPLQLHKDSLLSRSFWFDILVNVEHVYPLTTRHACNSDAPLRVMDSYHVNEQAMMEFQFNDSIHKQQTHDVREVNLSAIRSLLSSSQRGVAYKNQFVQWYKDNLTIPPADILVEFIVDSYSSEEIVALSQAHNGDVRALASDVMVMILREYIPLTLLDLFHAACKSIEQSVTKLNVEDFVREFLQEQYENFRYLTTYQQRDVKNRLVAELNAMINARLLLEYTERLTQHATAHMFEILTTLPIATFGDLADHICFYYQNCYPVVREAVTFLLNKHPDKMKQILYHEAERVIQQVLRRAEGYFDKWFNQNIHHLHEILRFFSVETQEFKPWMFEDVIRCTEGANGFVLTQGQFNSYLGVRVLTAVNARLSSLAMQQLKAYCDNSARRFFDNDVMKHELMNNQDITTLTMGVHVDVSSYVARFGSQATVQLSDLMHPLVGYYLQESLQATIQSFYRDKLQQIYHEVANGLMGFAGAIGKFAKFAELKNRIHDPQSLLLHLMSVANTSSDALLRTKYPCLFVNSNACVAFQEWFKANSRYHMAANFNQLRELMLVVDALMSIVAQLAKVLDEKNIAIGVTLQKLQQMVMQADLFTNFNHNYLYFQQYLERSIRTLFKELTNQSDYVMGGNVCGDYTSLMRPLVLQLMGRHSKPILLKNEIHAMDAEIAGILRADANLPWRKVNLDPTLLVLPRISVLPDTYQQPLTRELLIACVAFWLAHAHHDYQSEPPLIRYVIQVVNKCQSDVDINQFVLQQLRQHLLDGQPLHQMTAIYASLAVIDQIKVTLLKTNAFSKPLPSQIKFNALVKLFNLPVDEQVVEVQVNEADVARKTMELVRAAKAGNPNAQINISEISARARTLLQGSAVVRPPLLVSHVESKLLLRRNGIFNTSWFAESTTDIEEALLDLKCKHGNQHDFSLDEDDIAILAELIKSRWSMLCHYYRDAEKAYHSYVSGATRADRVYIALAELVAKHYRDQNLPVYTAMLLMPGLPRFQMLGRLTSQKLAPSMIAELGLDEASSSPDDILISDLIVTRSGYALNIVSILNTYLKNNSLVNPYTKLNFTDEEIEDIAGNVRFGELVQAVSDNRGVGITPQAIDYLVDYLNKAVFDDGFYSDYNRNQNDRAFNAYLEFSQRVLRLPAREQQALLEEKIPGESSETVKSVFADRERCLTLRAVLLARVVIAYRGRRHGIESAGLLERAHKMNIPARSFNDAVMQASTSLKVVEDKILVLAESGEHNLRMRR